MTTKTAINGFGRIGRLAYRKIMSDSKGELDLVAVNDIAPLDNLVYLLKYDSVHKDPEDSIEAKDGAIRWDSKSVKFLSEREPTHLPWKEMGVELVIEASGIFTKRDQAVQHLAAGAKKVLITAPGKNADLTVCMGVNENKFDPVQHEIVSNASCTTNCLAPVAKVIHEEFGIITGFLTTVHGYTSSQAIVDAPSKKWRRGRAGAVSIVPTTTGAAIATTLVLPELEGKLDGLAMRVPVPAGSIIDFVAHTEKTVSVEKVNQAFRQAAETKEMDGIVGITDDELVSADIIGSDYSAMVDAQSTMTLGENTVKVLAWYDNEWGYAQRVVDLANYMAKHS